MSSTPQVRNVTIDQKNDGQRLDNFLLGQLKGVPRTMIYRIVRKGEVRINGGRAKPSSKLSLGDQVRIPPVRVSQPGKVSIPDGVLERLANAEIYRNNDVLVIDRTNCVTFSVVFSAAKISAKVFMSVCFWVCL